MRASLPCSPLALPSNDCKHVYWAPKTVRDSDILFLWSHFLHLSCLGPSTCSSALSHSACMWCNAEPLEHTTSEEDNAPNYKVVVALCAAVSLICSIDRASISVAIVPMAEQYGWSDSAKGAISSSFFLGYTITNLIGIVTGPKTNHALHKAKLFYEHGCSIARSYVNHHLWHATRCM